MSAVLTSAGAEKAGRLEPEQWVERHGDALFRYAWARLREKSAAEDLVQETLLEAFKARRSFKGQCSEKSWLFQILKHNLLDSFRRRKVREIAMSPLSDYPDLVEPFETTGWRKGAWKTDSEPVDWHSPEESLSRREFWSVFHRCASKLPAGTSQVLLLREIDGLDGREICRVTGISTSNLWVILHRGRLALQRCLQKNWLE